MRSEGKRLTVHMEGNPVYDIVIRDSFFSMKEELEKMQVDRRKVCIVTETGVEKYYLKELVEVLKPLASSVKTFVFPQGEENKNLTTVSRLYDFLIREEYDRKDMLVALGGGVTGDLTGFTAATYLRGIDYIQVPTSLLSQVDSSVGGKTGVDFLSYKNMVGAFYMPKLVYINIATLKTLDDRQYRSGMGEVIKHGLIRDRSYYDWIRDHIREILARDIRTMSLMVEGSCRIKREVVEEDPKEQGIRAVLNFGHTLGHAIEKLSGFTLTHGECVAMGSQLAADLSVRRCGLTEEDYDGIKTLYQEFGFPSLPAQISGEEIVEETRHDKKMVGGKIRFVLLEKIGQAIVDSSISREDMLTCFMQQRNES